MIRIRPMTVEDLPLGLRLSRAAGWNQAPADWRRLLDLGPAGGFVAEVDGAAVGTTTTCVFGPIAWVAMVLVDPGARGRGVGTALVAHAIDHLERLGVLSIRLDATPLGEPLYRRLGFVAEYPLTRFQGTAATPAAGAVATSRGVSVSSSLSPWERAGVRVRTLEARGPHPGPLPGGEGEEGLDVLTFDPHDFDELLALDRSATGTDRARLLTRLVAEYPDEVRTFAPEVTLDGYLMARPGAFATQIGPCIARPRAGAILLADALARHRGRPVVVDVPAGNAAAREVVAAAGLAPRRELLRMVRGDRVEGDPASLWASSGPEMG